MLKIALKDLRLFTSDKKGMILTFLLPILLITLFAFAFGGAGSSKEGSRPTQIIVADEDQSNESKTLINRLGAMKEFRVKETNAAVAEKLVKKGDEAAVLIVHKGFSDSINAGSVPFIELKYDAAREAETGMLRGALTGKLIGLIGSAPMAKNAIARFDKQYPGMDSLMRAGIHQQIASNFSPETTEAQGASFLTSTAIVADEESSPGLVHAVAGTAIMMLLFSVSGMGASLLDEKEGGTLKKLLYSPLPPHNILFGKMLSVNIISISQLLIMFTYAALAFGLDTFSHLLMLVPMIICTAYTCSAFGVFLASIAKTRPQVQGLSTLVVLTMSAIGGSMIPSFTMPEFMQKISVFSVNYWGIQGFYDIFWRGLSFSDPIFLMRLLVLFGIGTVLNGLALLFFRKNLLNLA